MIVFENFIINYALTLKCAFFTSVKPKRKEPIVVNKLSNLTSS